ncbi:hypothetical protein EON79_07480, partial [bacterium]
IERKPLQALVDLGEAAVPTLISVAENPKANYSVRLAALAALNGGDSPSALPLMLRGTSTFEGALKGEAMAALADYDDPRVAPAIIANLGRGFYFLGEPGVKVLAGMKGRALPDMIRALAFHPEAKVRSQLADAIGMTRDPRAAEPLLAALSDKDPEVRTSVAYALRRHPQPVVVTALMLSSQDASESVRAASMIALGILRAPEAFDTLARGLNDPSPGVRGAATSIVRIDGPRAVPLLLPLFKDERVRYEVARAVAPLKDRRTIPGLLEVLRTRDAYQGEEAGAALAEMGVLEAIPILLSQLADTYKGESAAQALFTLGPAAADALLAFYPGSGKAKPKVIEALGGTRDLRAVNLLLPLLPSPKRVVPRDDYLFDTDSEIALATIYALGHLRDRRALAPLLLLLKNEQWNWAAAEALGDLGAGEAVVPLIEALGQKRTRQDAALALAKLGDPRGIEPLLASLRQPENYDWQTIEALGSFRDPRVLTFLLEALTTGLQGRSAARAFGNLRDPATLPALRKAAEDDDERVAEAAKEAIAKIESP